MSDNFETVIGLVHWVSDFFPEGKSPSSPEVNNNAAIFLSPLKAFMASTEIILTLYFILFGLVQYVDTFK
jgi:hypothetical protein